MITRLRQAIDTAAVALAQAGIDSARIDAELLAAHFAGVDRGRLSLTEPSDPGFFNCFEAAVRTRARRTPRTRTRMPRRGGVTQSVSASDITNQRTVS